MADDRSDEGRPGTAGTRLVLGSLVAASRWLGRATSPPTAGDAQPPEPAQDDWRYVALGALLVAEEQAARLVRAGTGMLRVVTRPIGAVAAPFVPQSVRRDVERVVHDLGDYGRSAAVAGSDEAVEIVESLADDVIHDPAVLAMIEEVVDRLQWRVVDAVLPVVLERLTAEPEQVRELVQGQSRGMAEDVTISARVRAAAADDAVETFLERILHRHGRERRQAGPATPGPATALPSNR